MPNSTKKTEARIVPWLSILIFLTVLLAGCTASQQDTPAVTPKQLSDPALAAPTAALASPTAQLQAQVTPPESTPTAALSSAAPEQPLPTLAPFTPIPAPTEPISSPGLPDPLEYQWRPITGGLEKPVGLSNAGDGSNRLFIIEQPGDIRILQQGSLLPNPFLDIRRRVGSRGSEQGLLGLAFSPTYRQDGFFYVNYTNLDGDTVIARFQASLDDPQRADPQSEKLLLQVKQPFPNHNGGGMAFGPDGYLYLGLGDGGSGGDPQGNGQSLETLLGKLLRIDVSQGEPYSIPTGNPFASSGGRPEIWAFGLRNPWRFSFDRQTGDLYIGDVGQNRWEEIDFLPAGSPGGANFGWNFFEGTHPYQGEPPPGQPFVLPAVEYSHDQGCSVTGGVVYRGVRLPAWQGVYLFGDYCSGNVWGLKRAAEGRWLQALLFQGVGGITTFGEDESGEVYLADHSGLVYTLEKK